MGKMRVPRSRQPRKAPAEPRGLRVIVKGAATPEELRVAFFAAVDELEQLGIKQVRGVNIYLTPLDADGDRVVPTRDGRTVTSITIEPYRSGADEHGV
jgi:hypothetical protein